MDHPINGYVASHGCHDHGSNHDYPYVSIFHHDPGHNGHDGRDDHGHHHNMDPSHSQSGRLPIPMTALSFFSSC